ncbi:MAG: hypothetical protein ACPLPR_04860 [Bacillota bacterium]
MTEGVNFSVSLLARYPEVAMVRFNPKERTLQFSFLVQGRVSTQGFRELSQKLKEALETYSVLRWANPKTLNVKLSSGYPISIVEVERDVETLDRDEISLITALVSDYLGARVMREGIDPGRVSQVVPQEEQLMQEEIIEETLDTMRQTKARKGFVAIRDNGQVVVFNK